MTITINVRDFSQPPGGAAAGAPRKAPGDPFKRQQKARVDSSLQNVGVHPTKSTVYHADGKGGHHTIRLGASEGSERLTNHGFKYQHTERGKPITMSGGKTRGTATEHWAHHSGVKATITHEFGPRLLTYHVE